MVEWRWSSAPDSHAKRNQLRSFSHVNYPLDKLRGLSFQFLSFEKRTTIGRLTSVVSRPLLRSAPLQRKCTTPLARIEPCGSRVLCSMVVSLVALSLFCNLSKEGSRCSSRSALLCRRDNTLLQSLPQRLRQSRTSFDTSIPPLRQAQGFP